MRGGSLDPDTMISLLDSMADAALAEGYGVLRVPGETSWALNGFAGAEKLIECESKLNRWFSGGRCAALCQYDGSRFNKTMLLDVVANHPVSIIEREIVDSFRSAGRKLLRL